MHVKPLSLACLAAVASLAQADHLSPTIEVVGQRPYDHSTLTQPDLQSARDQMARTPGGAHVLDADSYRGGRVATLADSLGFAPGVFVQPRFGAEEARVSIRGSGLQRTFHGRGLKLMQDGVPMNLADGSFDFQAIEALTARYVEVWRGANALQYGASNLGGAINYASPNGRNAAALQARAEAGSYGYRRLQAASGNMAEDVDYYLSASGFQQSGFRRHAEQRTVRLFANIGWQLNPHLESRVYLGHADSDSDLPGSLTRAQLEADPRQAAAGNVSNDQQRDIRWSRISNKTVLRDGAQRYELAAYLSHKRLFHPIFQVLDQRNDDLGLELRYVNEAVWLGRGNRLVLGFAPSYGKTAEDRWLNQGGRRGVRSNQSAQRASNLELYLENQHQLSPQLALITGLQAAQARRRLNDQFVAGTPSDRYSESFSRRYQGINPKLGLLHGQPGHSQFYANLSRSFEPPSLSEISGGLYPVNNAAQRANSLEFGTRGRQAGLEWDLSVYHAALRQELLQIATNVVGANITVNAERTVHRGIEAYLGGQRGGLDWRLAGLVNDFRFDGDTLYGNRRLPGIPRLFLRAEGGYRLPYALRLGLNIESAPKAYAVDFADSLQARGYTLYGLKLQQTVGKQTSWFLEGRNLADKRYAATTGVLRDAGGKDSAQFMPGDGRAWYAGLSWQH